MSSPPTGFSRAFATSGRANELPEVAEIALAHTVGDKVEAAYRRDDLFQKRRQLMEAWARFCETPRMRAEVVPISGRA